MLFLRISLFKDIVKSHNISLSHLQSFVFGKLPVLSQLRKKSSQSIERLIQILHSPTLPSIGGQPPFSKDQRSHSTFRSSLWIRTGRLVTFFRKTVIAGRRCRTPIIGNWLLRTTRKINVTVWFDVRFHFSRYNKRVHGNERTNTTESRVRYE